MITSLLALAAAVGLGAAQFPPKPEGVKTLESRFHSGITISYKEPGICETTPGVKSYAGYVHLPVDALNETFEHNGYPINTFFWFFESRKDPANAPLAIWLNGGPGGSSLLGALSENGPCFIANDSKSTYLNPWSWNNEANLLVIDQPNQVGYSYDVLTNVTVNQGTEVDGVANIQPADFSDGVPEQNNTFFVGTTASQNVTSTANSTQHAAVALWHFAQTWFEEFPQYKPNDESISLFTESYGGHYGPGIMEYWLRQNTLIANGTISTPGAHYLHLNTLGIINGCIDAADRYTSLLDFAHNNTYSIRALTTPAYTTALHALQRPGGLLDDVQTCQTLQQRTDPHDHGTIAATNAFCATVVAALNNVTDDVYVRSAIGARFDITHEATDPFPPPYMFGYLNQQTVQAALGVPVNHSWYSPAVAAAFEATGDMAKGGQLVQLAHLLDAGVRVALLYGDRDYACNWRGGEATALRIPWRGQEGFAAAGYAPLAMEWPFTVSGGLVREYGNLSFARVYQAGHMVPSYQPEVAWRSFMRAVMGRDIATGEVGLGAYAAEHGEEWRTQGPGSTWHILSDVLPSPGHECYVLNAGDRCSEEEIGWIADGSAVVKDWILVGRNASMEVVGEEDGEVPPPAKIRAGQNPLLGDW